MKQSVFQKLCSELSPFQYTDYKQYLKSIYELVKSRTEEPWSYNIFSEVLGLGNGNVSFLLIKDKRKASDKSSKTMAQKIGLKNDERRYFLALVDFQIARTDKARDAAFKKMMELKSGNLKSHWDKKSLTFFSHWYYSAVYEILTLEEAKDDPNWLAGVIRPRVSSAKIKEAIEHMQDMNLLDYNESLGRIAPTNVNLTTGPEARGVIFTSYHQKMIQLGLEALVNETGSKRDISSVTISVNEESMQEIKKLSAEFRKKLLALSENVDEKDKVMQVNIQAFPLSEVVSKGQSKGKKKNGKD